MLRLAKPIALVALLGGLSGCSWYWETSKQIGEYMPTYEGWFGDGSKEQAESRAAAAYQAPQPSYYTQVPPVAPVADPSMRTMPVPGNPTSGYGNYAPPPPANLPAQGGYVQNYPPFAAPPPPPGFADMPPPGPGEVPPPPPGFAPPPAPAGGFSGGPGPAEGLQRLQMQQQQMQGGFAPPPQMPFTEPVLEQSAPVEEYSATVTEEAPPAPAHRGTFSFLDDIAETVGGWFGDSGEKEPYPNLASVPESEGYNRRMAETDAARTELEDAQADAQAKHREINDWSDLAGPESSPPMPETQVIMPNHTADSTAGLSSKTLPSAEYEPLPMPEPEKDAPQPQPKLAEDAPVVSPAPAAVSEAPLAELPAKETPKTDVATAPIMSDAVQPETGAPIEIKPDVTTPASATQPRFLRRPAAPAGALLPRNRYADRD